MQNQNGEKVPYTEITFLNDILHNFSTNSKQTLI